MTRLHLRHLTTIEQIRGGAPAWDRVWQQSEVSSPTARAEMTAQWLEQFTPRAAIRVLVVEQAGEAVAVLPLVGRWHRGVLPVGDLPANEWASNGELLLDPAADRQEVLDVLAGGIADLPWPLVWFDMAPVETVSWQGLLAAITRRGMTADVHSRYRIGQVQLEGDFAQYEARRSKNLRRQVRRDWQQLADDGLVELRLHWQFAPEEVEPRLRQAFEIEHHSWKRDGGQTVLGTPGMFEFYLRQAKRLAEWGYLRLAFLEYRGEPIAFEVGCTSKGVYHSYKVSYCSEYGRYSPGHLLRRELIQALYARPGHVLVDFQGPLTRALAQWSTCSYPIARLVVATRRPGSRALLNAYRLGARVLRRLRVAGRSSQSPR